MIYVLISYIIFVKLLCKEWKIIIKSIFLLILFNIFNTIINILIQIGFLGILYKLTKNTRLESILFNNKRILSIICIILYFISFSLLHLFFYYLIKKYNLIVISYILNLLLFFYNIISLYKINNK